jgi:hypothetical protein
MTAQLLARFRGHARHHSVGYVALFVALGGTTYAAATVGPGDIEKDAVRSKHIKAGGVKNPDLAAGSVGAEKVIDGSLLKEDFKAGQVPQGPPGPVGPVAKWKTATVAATQGITTSAISPTPLGDLATPGPQANVTVPTSGLAEVYAKVDFSGNQASGSVGLSVDGNLNHVGCFDTLPGYLINGPNGGSATGATAAGGGDGQDCGVLAPDGAPSSVMIHTTPGPHTFKLVYSGVSMAGAPRTINFSNRFLAVAPRP